MKRIYEMHYDEAKEEILLIFADHSELRIMVTAVEGSEKAGAKKSPTPA